MPPDLSLYDAADRKHVNPAERCDGCGAPAGPIARARINGVRAWAAPGVWWWTSGDGRPVGLYIPGLAFAHGAALHRVEVAESGCNLVGGKCSACLAIRPAGAAPLFDMMEE